MASTFSSAVLKTERQTLPTPSGSSVKADLKAEVAGTVLREVAAEALRRISSQKAAALTLAISEGRLSSKLQDGSLTIKHLEAFGAEYLAEFAAALAKRTGDDPAQRVRRLLRDIRSRLEDLEDEVTR